MTPPKLTPAQALIVSGHPEEALKYVGDDKYARAVCLRHLGRFPEALELLHDLVYPDKDHFAAWNSIGMIHTDLGEFDLARTAFSAANDYIQGKHLNSEAICQIRVNLAYAYMRDCDFEKAWPLWESARYGYAWQTPLVPWSGQPGRVLVVCEGGYGDQILFSRYLKQAKAFADITYYCFEDLIPIMPAYCRPMIPHQKQMKLSNYFPAVDWDKFDYATSIMSLPAICGIPTKTEGLTVKPILPADPGGWPYSPLPAEFRNGVGLCWAAEEVGVQRRLRSMPVEEFEPLKHLCFESLCPGRPHPDWISSYRGRSWEDTILALSTMRYVITIDTAVAHLAGALEIPTYLILPKGSDWKYFTERQVGDVSPWYRSVKLIRNTDPLDWKPAIQLLTEELRKDGRT